MTEISIQKQPATLTGLEECESFGEPVGAQPLPPAVRAAYAALLTTLYVLVQPHAPLSTSDLSCRSWAALCEEQQSNFNQATNGAAAAGHTARAHGSTRTATRAHREPAGATGSAAKDTLGHLRGREGHRRHLIVR